jgi:hypothetical protein
MSRSHLSDAARRAGPTWQHAITAWLPRASPLQRVKSAVGTSRRRPNSAVPIAPSPLSQLPRAASPCLSRPRRHRCPKPCRRHVRIPPLSSRPTLSRASSTVSIARALLSPFFICGASTSPSPPSSPSQDHRRPL